MVTYQIDDKYCPEGHKWTFCPSSLMFRDCYYCKNCDKVYGIRFLEITKKWFSEHYNSDRRSDIIHYAEMIDAREKVTNEDLIKLGYLKPKTK